MSIVYAFTSLRGFVGFVAAAGAVLLPVLFFKDLAHLQFAGAALMSIVVLLWVTAITGANFAEEIAKSRGAARTLRVIEP